jgi:hypothetical protein
MVKLNPPPLRAASSEATDCQHCGRSRIVARLSELVGLQRRHPVPGFDEVIAALQRLYSASQLIAVCPGCLCITADLGRHRH